MPNENAPPTNATPEATSTGNGETNCLRTTLGGSKLRPQNLLGWQKPNTPRATQKPTVKDIYWAAGFYEGEGFATDTKTSQQISAVQVNKEPLERLQKHFGGTVRLQNRYAYTRPNSKPIWRWRICGPRARGFAMTIFTLLSKRRQEQLVKIGLMGGPRA
jgi:hypothetical protein